MTLDELRVKIAEIDNRLLELFNERDGACPIRLGS